MPKVTMNEYAPGFEGVFCDDTKQITQALADKGALLKLDFFTHSYPYDWRTKKPVIFRQRHNGLRQLMLSVIRF